MIIGGRRDRRRWAATPGPKRLLNGEGSGRLDTMNTLRVLVPVVVLLAGLDGSADMAE